MIPSRSVSRFVGLSFVIDTNRINALGNAPEMDPLERWKADGVILMETAQAVLEECNPENSPSPTGRHAQRTAKAKTYVAALTGMDSFGGNEPQLEKLHRLMNSPEEQVMQEKIASILFGTRLGALNPNKRNDVRVVYAARQHDAILITKDGGSKTQPGGILGNRDALRREIGTRAMRAAEAVSLVRGKISARDLLARLESTSLRQSLPDWVGKD